MLHFGLSRALQDPYQVGPHVSYIHQAGIWAELSFLVTYLPTGDNAAKSQQSQCFQCCSLQVSTAQLLKLETVVWSHMGKFKKKERKRKSRTYEAFTFLYTTCTRLAWMSDLYSIPDLSVAYWFRLHRNTHIWMEVRFFCWAFFSLPLYPKISHMETPSGCLSSWYSILQLCRLCTQKIDCTTFIKNDTPTVYISSPQLQCLLSPQVRTNLLTGTCDPNVFTLEATISFKIKM